jgi:phage terminase large subunit-like protein
MTAPDTVTTRGRTTDNKSLPADFVAAVEDRYGGTRLGRQELEREYIEDIEGALWTWALIEKCRVRAPETGTAAGGCPQRVVIGVDPPASGSGDACGIVACALGADGLGYVLGDHSVSGLSREGWARAVVGAAETWEADLVIVQTNQGGDEQARHGLGDGGAAAWQGQGAGGAWIVSPGAARAATFRLPRPLTAR